MKVLRNLPNPDEIKNEFPISEKAKKIKAEKDRILKDILAGKNDLFALIIGPCSADNEDALIDYTLRLAAIQEKVADKIFIVPRVYTNKPRTTGKGYKGMASQPDPEKKEDMLEGLHLIRQTHVAVVEQTGMTCADEMLYPENYEYLSDVLSYVAIGARSVENQQHRLTASGISVPCGMKNPTSGYLTVMLNSIEAAQCSHHFIYRQQEVETEGNPYTHAILRGSVNKHGKSLPNYHYEDLLLLHEIYCQRNLENMAVVIDTNHNNSGKRFKEQIRISKEVLESRRFSSDIRNMVKGLMIESYIEDGCQKIGEGVYGRSITDPCLGWEKTEKLIYEIADLL
ncbi:MAG: 3-deoxy-7-phosphoheptulonate synthase [Eubacterium sp.]|nr:3-deoxy-7-phosphoheptulonate synthase [Eubacterium sp.]MCI9412353.1 3-deoxy-7-phosphoheptulonate synthase [Eubacterium sp.]